MTNRGLSDSIIISMEIRLLNLRKESLILQAKEKPRCSLNPKRSLCWQPVIVSRMLMDGLWCTPVPLIGGCSSLEERKALGWSQESNLWMKAYSILWNQMSYPFLMEIMMSTQDGEAILFKVVAANITHYWPNKESIMEKMLLLLTLHHHLLLLHLHQLLPLSLITAVEMTSILCQFHNLIKKKVPLPQQMTMEDLHL